MSEELFVSQCAPTLAGVKTGSLFSCPYETREELRKSPISCGKLSLSRRRSISCTTQRSQLAQE